MDPDANLAEQIKLAKRIRNGLTHTFADDALRLAALVIALNDWLSNAGALPIAWDWE